MLEQVIAPSGHSNYPTISSVHFCQAFPYARRSSYDDDLIQLLAHNFTIVIPVGIPLVVTEHLGGDPFTKVFF